MGIYRYGPEHAVRQRWFDQAELICAAAAGALCFSLPEAGGYPLLLILAPWILRAIAGDFPIKRTPLDPYLAVFALSAGFGLWAAYDSAFALSKLWVLLSAAALFYALARQPRENRFVLWGLLAALPVFISAYFLLTHDWAAVPQKISWLNRLGEYWMSIRPEIALPRIHPNRAAGMMGMYTPFLIGVGLIARREGRRSLVLALLAGLGLVAAGLIMTVSRGGLIATTTALGTWFLWPRWKKLAQQFDWAGLSFLLFIVVLILIIGSLLILNGQESGINRLTLFGQVIHLIRDFPFSGGGLGAFPGLFSRYILSIPFFYFSNGHNVFLDIALEQGLLGLIAFGLIIGQAAFWLVNFRQAEKDPDSDLLRWAILASVIVFGLHGLVTDTLYAERATPLLFVQAGMTMHLVLSAAQPVTEGAQGARPGTKKMNRPWTRPGRLIALAGVMVLIYVLRAPLVSAAIANRGAVGMSRIELNDFPKNAWDEGEKLGLLRRQAALFQAALGHNPGNQTANYRLGLIAMAEQDFVSAADFLESAYQVVPGHRGVVKSLGFSYVWLGKFAEAKTLLDEIPEAQDELVTYIWWWQARSRADLSGKAEQMTAYFQSTGVKP